MQVAPAAGAGRTRGQVSAAEQLPPQSPPPRRVPHMRGVEATEVPPELQEGRVSGIWMAHVRFEKE
jgi:hypothetical protein